MAIETTTPTDNITMGEVTTSIRVMKKEFIDYIEVEHDFSTGCAHSYESCKPYVKAVSPPFTNASSSAFCSTDSGQLFINVSDMGLYVYIHTGSGNYTSWNNPVSYQALSSAEALDMNNRQISNLAAGTQDRQSVNLGQISTAVMTTESGQIAFKSDIVSRVGVLAALSAYSSYAVIENIALSNGQYSMTLPTGRIVKWGSFSKGDKAGSDCLCHVGYNTPFPNGLVNASVVHRVYTNDKDLRCNMIMTNYTKSSKAIVYDTVSKNLPLNYMPCTSLLVLSHGVKTANDLGFYWKAEGY